METNAQAYEKFRKYLFAPEEELEDAIIAKSERSRIIRIRDTFIFWEHHPQLSDKDVVRYVQERWGITFQSALKDMAIIKTFIGDVNSVSRKYNEWLFRQRFEEAWTAARKSREQASAMARLLAVFIKANQLDRPENETPDYTQIVPQSFEITPYPEDAGFERIPNVATRVRKLLSRYSKEIDDIANAEEAEEITLTNEAESTAAEADIL